MTRGRTGARGAGRGFRSGARGAGRRLRPRCAPANPGGSAGTARTPPRSVRARPRLRGFLCVRTLVSLSASGPGWAIARASGSLSQKSCSKPTSDRAVQWPCRSMSRPRNRTQWPQASNWTLPGDTVTAFCPGRNAELKPRHDRDCNHSVTPNWTALALALSVSIWASLAVSPSHLAGARNLERP